MLANFANSFVQLSPALQELIALGVTALVSFLILQIAEKYPELGAYLGQYKVGIVTTLTAIFVQLAQTVLNQVPVEWESVAVIAMQLLAEVIIVLIGFAAYRRIGAKGSRALTA